MNSKRFVSLVVILIILAGCGKSETATLLGQQGSPVTVDLIATTGDGIPVTMQRNLAAGTRVEILGDGPDAQTAKVRIQDGESKGLEAMIPRSKLRIDP